MHQLEITVLKKLWKFTRGVGEVKFEDSSSVYTTAVSVLSHATPELRI